MLPFSLTKQEWHVLLIIFAFILLFFKPVIAGDGIAYYALLESGVQDFDFDLTNQQRFDDVDPQLNFIKFNETTQKYVVSQSPGMALLAAPLYSLSLFLDDFQIFHIKDAFFLKERQDILIHQFAFALTSLIFLFLGLIFSIKILKEFFHIQQAHLIVLLTFFGSSMLRYATYDISYTMATELGLFAIFAYFFFKNQQHLLQGILLGILTLVRPSAALFIFPLIAFNLFEKNYSQIKQILIGFIPFVFLFMLYLNSQFGGFLTSGYSQPFEWFQYIIPTLISPHQGFLFWTPLLLLSLFGVYKTQNKKVFTLFTMFLIYLIFYGSWFSGTSFGQRYFSVFFILFAIGVATLWNNVKFQKPIIILSAYTLILFLLYTALGPGEHLFENLYIWFIDGQIVNFPQKLFEKFGIVRFLLEK